MLTSGVHWLLGKLVISSPVKSPENKREGWKGEGKGEKDEKEEEEKK